MKTIYEADDGKIFNSEEECRSYESKRVKLYSHTGVTTNPWCARVVVLPFENSADTFIKMCKCEKTLSNGIYSKNAGIFIWDENNSIYVELDHYTEEALEKYFSDKNRED